MIKDPKNIYKKTAGVPYLAVGAVCLTSGALGAYLVHNAKDSKAREELIYDVVGFAIVGLISDVAVSQTVPSLHRSRNLFIKILGPQIAYNMRLQTLGVGIVASCASIGGVGANLFNTVFID